MNRRDAQQRADRLRLFREELAGLEREGALTLTPEQRAGFEAWHDKTLAGLAAQFDVDTTAAEHRLSWGLMVASTLGGLALCAAVALFFLRWWGYLATPVQVALVLAAPLAALAGTEYAARKDRTLYFAGLMSLVTLGCFVLNLAVVGTIFSITSTEGALAAWSAVALLLAYRHGLRVPLVAGIGLGVSWVLAATSARLGYHWLDFGDRPEPFLLAGAAVFACGSLIPHRRNGDFPAVYRLAGLLCSMLALLFLAGEGGTWLGLEQKVARTVWDTAGLALSAGAIWLGIRRGWDGTVYTSGVFFAIFLYVRLFRWWWDWMPKYLFFAVLGGLAIVLVVAMKRLRERMKGGAA
jgi:uncharacterized membrane protein